MIPPKEKEKKLRQETESHPTSLTGADKNGYRTKGGWKK